MYFPFFKLHSWDKRSAVRRRRFTQRLLKGKVAERQRGRMRCRVHSTRSCSYVIFIKKHTVNIRKTMTGVNRPWHFL